MDLSFCKTHWDGPHDFTCHIVNCRPVLISPILLYFICEFYCNLLFTLCDYILRDKNILPYFSVPSICRLLHNSHTSIYCHLFKYLIEIVHGKSLTGVVVNTIFMTKSPTLPCINCFFFVI